jgi:hypothetical protein
VAGRIYSRSATIALVVGPLCLFVLPTLWSPGVYEEAAEHLAATADDTARGYWLLTLQLIGATLIVPAAIGIMRLLEGRSRGVRLGHAAGLLTLLGSFSVMVVLGMEYAQVVVLEVGTDVEEAVWVALGIQEGTAFGLFLIGGLFGVFVGVLGLVVALWRARIVPVRMLALFALPVGISFLPLSGAAGELAVVFALILPLAAVGWAIARAEPTMEADAPVAA